MKAYRFVTDDLKSQHGDTRWVVGEWQKCEGKLGLCANGLHASKKPLDSLNNVFGTRWFLCEVRGKVLEGRDKLCAEEMRILQEIPLSIVVQFAADCAKRVEHLQNSTATSNAWRAAAWAVREAAWAVGEAAGEAAVRAAGEAAAGAVREAAWAVGEAAGEAAWEAAWEAERKWQNRHFVNLIRKSLKSTEE